MYKDKYRPWVQFSFNMIPLRLLRVLFVFIVVPITFVIVTLKALIDTFVDVVEDTLFGLCEMSYDAYYWNDEEGYDEE